MVDYYVTNSFSTVKRTSCCFTIFFDKQIVFETFPYSAKIGNYRVTNSKVLCQINLTQQKKELSCYLRFIPLAEMVSCPTAHTLTWASIHKKTCAFTQCIALTNSKNSPHLRSQGLFTYLEASSGCWLLLEYPIK